MERIVIPGKATYTPVALTDLFMAAPTASRLLLGAAMPGQVVAAAALGYYAGSATRDWVARWKIRPIEFFTEYGADVKELDEMPDAAREAEIRLLGHALNMGYTAERPTREALAERVNDALTRYIAAITGQEIITSSQVRSFNQYRVVMPFARGTCDVISGDVAIFEHSGVLESHVIAHEFCHRKGYLKELHAQALAYMAMRTSGDPLLIQGARAERLHRQLAVLAGEDPVRWLELLNVAALRPELYEELSCLRPADGTKPGPVTRSMKAMYDRRMKLSGQNGIRDYDEGFTRFLWTFWRSDRARQPRAHAAI